MNHADASWSLLRQHENDRTITGRTPTKMTIINLIKANLKDRGASMVEYAFLVILIAIIAIVAVQIAGQEVSTSFSDIADGLAN
jgi:Flp pilus assembly pilin Flp